MLTHEKGVAGKENGDPTQLIRSEPASNRSDSDYIGSDQVFQDSEWYWVLFMSFELAMWSLSLSAAVASR